MVEVKGVDFVELNDLSQEELENIMLLDTDNEELEIENEDDSSDLILKAMLDIKREEYITFYEDTVKDSLCDFINQSKLDGTVCYEARIKRDNSVKNSLARKDIKLDELKDYLGVRFITTTKEEAYTVAGLFMINYCIPKDREEYQEGDENKFNAYQTKDYFKRPKLDKDGNVQYSGIHIFLEKDGKKFEMQIHDLESYICANLTHDEYKTRKAVKRETEELDIEEVIQYLE